MNSKSMKKWILLLATIVLILSGLTVQAGEYKYYKSKRKVVTYTGSLYKVYYQGTLVSDDKHPAFMINDNIMIPYKTPLSKRGPKLKASYNSSKKLLRLQLGTYKVKMTLHKKYMYVNGSKKKLNTAATYVIMNNKKYVVVPAKAICAALHLNYSYVKSEKAVYISKPVQVTNSIQLGSTLTAKSFANMSTKQFIEAVGPLAQADYKKTGVLASVTIAQAINESGWGKTALAQASNNIFGMKTSLSGNTWSGSVWDGKSYTKIKTVEEYNGKKVTITAKFRKYDSVARSIADHSAYLCNAMNGSSKRYAGLTSTSSYSRQLKILQKGGYCTWSSYVSELTSLIKKYNLTKYDVK